MRVGLRMPRSEPASLSVQSYGDVSTQRWVLKVRHSFRVTQITLFKDQTRNLPSEPQYQVGCLKESHSS